MKENTRLRKFSPGKGYCSVGDVHFDRAKEVPFGDRILYIAQAKGDDGSYVVIPGYKLTGSHGENLGPSEVMVEPILDGEERRVVSKLLKSLGEGRFVFWD